MNEKYESNNVNYVTDSLITNINNVQFENHKSSLSSKSSQSSLSSFSSFRNGKTDPEDIKRQKQNCRNYLCHDNYCYLIKMIWFFNIFGFHRFLILIFKCDECKKEKYILMEKSQRGKEMNIGNAPKSYNGWYILKGDYFPKSKISYYCCEQCFVEASGDWTLITNNCGHFAKYIWEKIIKKDKKKKNCY
jgi:hypothetical protein